MRNEWLALLLLSASAPAQVTIEGTAVRKTTGKPLPGIGVTTSCGPNSEVATDSAGRFRFAGVPVGNCVLAFNGPGWLRRIEWITVKPEDTRIALRVPITPQAVIAGRLLDENGWPVSGGRITAAQYRSVYGVRQLQAVRSAPANDRGEYRIGKLPPGRYYIRVRAGRDNLPSWYPGVLEVENARAIDLREGQQAAGMDVHLGRSGGVEVRGRVIPPAGVPPGQVHVRFAFEDLGVTSPGPSVPLAPGGSFTLHHVSPGRYILSATTSDIPDNAAPPAFLAWRRIEVAGENIDGITLNVVQTVLRDLKGTVVCDGAVKPEQVQIGLQRRMANNLRLTAKVQPDGSFVIPGVWPGEYHGTVSTPAGQVTSMLLGEREILNRDFDFDGTEAPLRVTVSERPVPVGISGTLADAGNRPVAGAAVIFVPEGGAYNPSPPGPVTMPANTDQNGAFSARWLPRGSYRVYVVEDPAEILPAMEDREFLQSQEKAFPPVKIAAGETAPLKLVLPAKQPA